MNNIIVNGKLLNTGDAVLKHDNRGFRYGDGVFETIRVINGKITLEHLHAERLMNSLNVLKFRITAQVDFEVFKKHILALCRINACEASARVRLTIFRGNAGLFDGDLSLQYLIECSIMEEHAYSFNNAGLTIGIFPDARKSCDIYSNLKSANYLPYVMAALYARENEWDDAIVLNAYNRIADADIANVFWVKDKCVYTPPLSEGCVDGVMRKYLIEKMKETDLSVFEKPLELIDLENADEIFLTNAIKGIRWVDQFHEKKFANTISSNLYKQFITAIHC